MRHRGSEATGARVPPVEAVFGVAGFLSPMLSMFIRGREGVPWVFVGAGLVGGIASALLSGNLWRCVSEGIWRRRSAAALVAVGFGLIVALLSMGVGALLVSTLIAVPLQDPSSFLEGSLAGVRACLDIFGTTALPLGALAGVFAHRLSARGGFTGRVTPTL